MHWIASMVGMSLVVLALVGGTVTPAAASFYDFLGGPGVTIPATGTGPAAATPYPSPLDVAAACDVVTDVNLYLTGLSHAWPSDVDILLVGPGGQEATVLSDVGGADPITDVELYLDDEALTDLPASSVITTGTYKPTNAGVGDTFESPAPIPSGDSALSVFDGTNPNGTWNLFVRDDSASQVGDLDSWYLTITSTRTSEICIPGAETHEGVAAPYPDSTSVSGLGSLTDVNLVLTGLSHQKTADVDVLLVGPGGQNAIVMADVGGDNALAGVNLTLDDEAPGSLPIVPFTSGSFKPTNIGAGDTFDSPAPAPSGGSALSVFDGTSPNGTWSLFVLDDDDRDVGRITDWSLQITAPPLGATPAFSPSINLTGAKAKEGKPIAFQVNLSAAPAQPFAVPFATVGGSAKAGKDFKAVSGNLTFAPGEASKSVVVKTKNDPKDEKNNEKFSLQLTTATGNLLATAKIKDNDK